MISFFNLRISERRKEVIKKNILLEGGSLNCDRNLS